MSPPPPSEETPLVDKKHHANNGSSLSWASLQCETLSTLLGATQLILVFLFAMCTTYSSEDDSYSPAEYIIFRDIMVMLLLGFGYLMTFLSKYGLGAVGFTLLLSTYAMQLNVLVELFCRFLFKWMIQQ
jgi:hypothetical protein